MTIALSPEAMAEEIRACKRALDDLLREYAVAYDVAHSRQVTDQAHVSGGRSDRDGDILKAVTEGRGADPLKSVAFDHRKLRAELRFASEFVRLFLYGRRKPDRFFGVLDQVDVLRMRLEKDEQRHGAEFDAVKFPRTAYRDDVEESVAAQVQRREAGDIHTGENSEARDKLGLPALEQEFRRGVR